MGLVGLPRAKECAAPAGADLGQALLPCLLFVLSGQEWQEAVVNPLPGQQPRLGEALLRMADVG